MRILAAEKQRCALIKDLTGEPEGGLGKKNTEIDDLIRRQERKRQNLTAATWQQSMK